jgi:predicted AAA+ superfamily ATPase
LLNVGSLRDFDRFLRACAARSAQLLNKSQLARDVGLAVSTVGQWLSALEASGLITILEPYFDDHTKRIVKTPKLYFNDVGLLCFLLGLDARSAGQWAGISVIGVEPCRSNHVVVVSPAVTTPRLGTSVVNG